MLLLLKHHPELRQQEDRPVQGKRAERNQAEQPVQRHQGVSRKAGLGPRAESKRPRVGNKVGETGRAKLCSFGSQVGNGILKQDEGV